MLPPPSVGEGCTISRKANRCWICKNNKCSWHDTGKKLYSFGLLVTWMLYKCINSFHKHLLNANHVPDTMYWGGRHSLFHRGRWSSPTNPLYVPQWAPWPLILQLIIWNRKWLGWFLSCFPILYSINSMIPFRKLLWIFFLDAINHTNLILLAWLVTRHRRINETGVKSTQSPFVTAWLNLGIQNSLTLTAQTPCGWSW